jgi:Ca2+-binding RTX toxin-like protein
VNEGGADGINGGAGSDTVVKRGSGTFTLSNYSLSAGSDYVSISSIENATLIGGNGTDIFNMTGWTGGVTIQGGGGLNTLMDSADGNFVVLPNLLTRTVGSVVSTIHFSEIDNVHLTGGFGNNTFDLSAWPNQAVLSGGYWGTDTVRVAGNVDYMLTDVLLQRPGLGMIRLSGFENAIITGGSSANTFNLSNWNQAASLDGADGNDKLVMAGNVNFTLTDQALTRSTGGAVALTSIEQAELIGGAGNNTINATGFSGRVKIDGAGGNDTITGGSGIAMLLGGAGNDVINAGTGRSMLIGGLGVDRLTGGTGDDLLIDGQTAHDASAAALDALLAEWASNNNYLDRVAHLTGTSGGANGSTHLGGSNVIHDTAIDILLGGDGDDLFFAKLDSPALDVLSDKQPNESAH